MKKIVFSIIFLVSLVPFIVYGEDDLFQVQTPNVMIIFDTSSSMEMSLNLDTKGNSIWTTQKGPDKVTPYRQDGNHPDSKLYQAKKALSNAINDVVKDRVNLGFSTYAQEKIEKWRGKYQRDEEVIDQAAQTEAWRRYKRYYLWDTANESNPPAATSIYPDSFYDYWGFLQSPVTAHPTTGTTFTRTIWIHDKSGPLHPKWIGGNNFQKTKSYTVTYRVTARTLNPETNIYSFTYIVISAAYDRYSEQYFYNEGYTTTELFCGADTKNNPFPDKQGSWKTYFPGDGEYDNPSNARTPGWWNCNVDHRLAKSKISHFETKYYWDNTTGSTCDATKAGTPIWNLIPGTCFDWSGYKYTPEGTTNRPDTWSYFKKDGSNYWKKGQPPQDDPYYPAPSGNPGENNNHHFFINFPDDKGSGFKDSDRTAIKNTILDFLDLTPVKRPDASEYWTKLPVHAKQGLKGLTANMDPLNAYAFNTQKQTPLADSLNWAYTYFYDYINKYNGGDSPSKEKFGETLCRGNYIIMLTDGLESCRFDKAGKPDYNAAPQEAANLLAINVKTFIIGFGGDVIGNQTLNNIAAAGGTGKAYFTVDFKQLKEALQSIFQAITGQYYGRSNPVIARDRSRLFRGNFDIRDGDWMGHLMAWDADKQTGVLAPDFAWDAGEQMTMNGRGKVYTWTDTGLNPSRKEFKVSDSSLYPLVNLPVTDTDSDGILDTGEDINNDGSINNLDAVGVIKFTLDPNYNDCDDGIVDKVALTCHGPGYYKGKRAINVDIKGIVYSAWNLGDVYHSTPVVIGEPAFLFKDNDYATFYNNNKNREMIIYVGTNDGMLHAIKNSDGTEKFAIIPKNLLGKLKNLRITHDFYVDSSPKAYDVYFNAESKWKTVLISGERGGGTYYFAIDVTDPNNPSLIWQWPNLDTDPEMQNLGETWAKPEIGKVKVGSDTKFVAFFTGGYSTTDNKGNSFYIVDIETGTTLKMWTQSNGYPVGSKTNKIVSAPTVYDVNQDGFIEYVYFGDIEGTLWKVDVSSTVINDWTPYNFFTPMNPMPIFYSPSVVKNDEGKTLIFFGTGNELGLTALTTNYFYEIEDQGATGKESWSKTLENGEKVLASPAVANYVVYFTTWVYKTSSEFCGAGEGRLWGLKISSTTQKGGDAGLVTLDPNTGQWTSPQEYISLGTGIPSAPVVTNGMVYVSTSLNANKVIQIPIPPWTVAKVKSWREVVR